MLAKQPISAEAGVQVGKQVAGQMKDNWDNDRDLTDVKWRCVDINWNHVALSGGLGAVVPGLLTSAKGVFSSGKAIKTLSGQAANTTNRAAKLAARKAAHKKKINQTVMIQAGWQATKLVAKCLGNEDEKECVRP